MKKRIGVTVDDDALKKFREILKKLQLDISPVINEMIKDFNSKEEELLND